jgi:chromate transporter
MPGFAGSCIALLALFLPGVLILAGTLPFWELFRQRVWAQSVMRGVNAAVVGLLGAALFDPVWTSTMHTHADFAVALACFVLLVAWRVAPIFIVTLGALSGLALAAFGGM